MQWFKVAFSPTFELGKSENGLFIVLPIREYPSSSNCPLRLVFPKALIDSVYLCFLAFKEGKTI